MQRRRDRSLPDSRLFRSHVVGGDGGGILTWPDTQMTGRDPADPEDGQTRPANAP